MTNVKVVVGRDFASGYKRFKKRVERAGILAEVRGRQAFMKPSDKKRLDKLKAIKRARLAAKFAR